MARPDRFFDWQPLLAEQDRETPPGAQERCRAALLVFALLTGAVFIRAVQLEATDGQGFRDEAARPLRQTMPLAGTRGRIVARDGTVLACDRHVAALAVHYRALQEPPDPQWLRQTARARLSRAERRDAARVAVEEAAIRREHRELRRRLADLCGLSPDEWQARASRIQQQVAALSARVNERRLERYRQRRVPDQPTVDDDATRSLWGWIGATVQRLLAPADEQPPQSIVVAEEQAYHVMVEDLPPAVAEEIKSRPQIYPGVQVRELRKRFYPCGVLAAHVVGHLGGADENAETTASVEPEAEAAGAPADGRRGRLGIERQYESVLRSQPGNQVQMADRRGNILSVRREREPRDGADVVLSLDPALQRAAESMLDHALKRRGSADASQSARPVGGAILVMNVATGEILAAASAPRFDPNLFETRHSDELEQILTDDSHPLFDRAIKMAIPPGSVFKTLSAVALLETGAVDPDQTFECQGYLDSPDRQRCYIYQRYGVGHGELTLVDALARSCNVFFFNFARQMGARPLANWAGRFGLGAPTGIDLPDESAGQVPRSADRRREQPSGEQGPNGRNRQNIRRDEDAESLAIGQGALTVTPVQIARLMAAVANGGRLVTPRVALRVNPKSEPSPASSASSEADELAHGATVQIAGLKPETLATVREGLRRVVADPDGTAYGTVRLQSVAIAGKTGTAQTGQGRQDHAWFAGYAPADAPRFAFVVVLEHGGGAAAAGPLAKRLVLAMQELGCFDAPNPAAAITRSE